MGNWKWGGKKKKVGSWEWKVWSLGTKRHHHRKIYFLILTYTAVPIPIFSCPISYLPFLVPSTFHFHLGNRSVQREWDRDNRTNYYRNRVYVLRNKKHLLARPVFCKQSGDYTIMTIIGNSPLRGNLGGWKSLVWCFINQSYIQVFPN